MPRSTRIEIIRHAMRWANNMLVEVISNHASALDDDARLKLRDAVSALSDASAAVDRAQS